MNKKRKCVKCGKEVLETEGVFMLRGITFVCKDCHNKEKHETKKAEVCEFC